MAAFYVINLFLHLATCAFVQNKQKRDSQSVAEYSRGMLKRLLPWTIACLFALPAYAQEQPPQPQPLQPQPQQQPLPLQPVINWPAAPGSLSPRDRVRAYELARQSIERLSANDPAGAEALLRQALAIIPDKAVWHYNLASILCGKGQADHAMDSLERAVDCGFTDFTRLKTTNDVAAVRSSPRFEKLLARQDEIRRAVADRAIAQYRDQFGPNYHYAADEQHKLIFAVAADESSLDAIRQSLDRQSTVLGAELFTNRPDEFIRILVPNLYDYRRLMRTRGVLGIYEDETRTLLAERFGQVMTHEFTHALHAADQRALGQEHPLWLREGLASLCETADFADGKFAPVDNYRLPFIQSAGKRGALWPFEKMLKLTLLDFSRSPLLAYGQTGSVMLYLHDTGNLRKFYEAYTHSYASDPSGKAALEQVTGMKLDALETAWREWMLKRKAPSSAPVQGGAYLGIHFTQVIDGLRAMVVIPTGPAAAAGVQAGDVLVSMDGKDVRDHQTLNPIIAAHKPGDKVALRVRRDGMEINVEVTLGER